MDSLLFVLRKHIKAPSFKYGTKQDVFRCWQYQRMILDFRAIGHSLSFCQSDMKSAAKALQEEKKWTSMKDAHKWPAMTSQRIRTLLRHVSQAEIKGTEWAIELLAGRKPKAPAAWIQEDGDEQPAQTAASSSQATTIPADTQYYYGFYTEKMMAWRMPASGGEEELTCQFSASGFDSDPNRCILARWIQARDHRGHERHVREDGASTIVARGIQRGGYAISDTSANTSAEDSSEGQGSSEGEGDSQAERKSDLAWTTRGRRSSCVQIPEGPPEVDPHLQGESCEVLPLGFSCRW